MPVEVQVLGLARLRVSGHRRRPVVQDVGCPPMSSVKMFVRKMSLKTEKVKCFLATELKLLLPAFITIVCEHLSVFIPNILVRSGNTIL